MTVKYIYLKISTLLIAFFFAIVTPAYGLNDSLANKTYVFMGSDNYPPFEYVGKDGKPAGFNVELFETLMNELNLPYKITLGDWDLVKDSVYAGKIDGVIGMIYSKDRAENVRFSMPACIINRSLISRKKDGYRTLEQLKGKEVIVQSDGWLHHYLVERGVTDKIIPVRDLESGLRLLSEGKYDAMLGSDLVFFSESKKMGVENLVIYNTNIPAQEYSIAVNMANDELLRQINTGLQQLKINGEYDRIYNKWFSIYEKRQISKLAVIIILSIVGLLLASIIFIYVLRKQVEKATKNLSQANGSLDLYRRKTEMAIDVCNISQWDYSVKDRCFRSFKLDGFFLKETVSEDDFLAMTHSTSLHDAKRFLEEMDSGENRTIEVQLKMLVNGDLNTYIICACPFQRDKDGNAISYTGMSLNNTERQNLINELIYLKNKAEHSDHLKSAFLANMSHEIRTPLNAIVGFSQLLPDVENKEEAEEYISIISQNNELLLKLINDILDLSKIDSGYIDLKEKDFDLSEFFQTLYKTYLPKMSDSVELVCDIPVPHCVICFDQIRLNQIIGNFLNNAIKFTAEGEIHLGYELVDGGVKCFVSDTGMGIKDEHKEVVFDRFQKLNTFVQGTGLGLAICKSIIDAKGGTIGVDSEYGVGSTFWAIIPCEVELKDYVEGASVTQGAELFRRKIVFDGAKKPNVIVVEDEDHNFELIKSLLRKQCNIERAINGEEAIEKVQTKKPDFVLMDIRLPVLNGIDATKKIREFDQETPIIAVTAYYADNNIEDVKNAGCDAYVAKPLDKNIMKGILKKLNAEK